MKKSEFKICLNENKKLNDLVKKVAEKKFGWKCSYFFVCDGKIWAADATQKRDVTKEVLAELMPDDLIF